MDWENDAASDGGGVVKVRRIQATLPTGTPVLSGVVRNEPRGPAGIRPGDEIPAEGEYISESPPSHAPHHSRSPSVHPRNSTPVHAEYEDADGRDPRHPMGLAVVEPAYSSPPLPPWLLVDESEDGPRSPDLVMLRAPNSPAAQQFRTLRYRLEQEPDAQIVAVISPRNGEGKSVTAANLALALAEGGRVKVLLVDAALRAPSQAALFGLPGDTGLSTAIADRWENPRGLVPVTRVGRSLFVMPAGQRTHSPHTLLASEAAAQLLGALRRTFRYIIVDASPVFGPAETLAWHGMIDRYVMVARRGRTTTEDLGKAADRINRDKILGVTFVGARPDSIVT